MKVLGPGLKIVLKRNEQFNFVGVSIAFVLPDDIQHRSRLMQSTMIMQQHGRLHQQALQFGLQIGLMMNNNQILHKTEQYHDQAKPRLLKLSSCLGLGFSNNSLERLNGRPKAYQSILHTVGLVIYYRLLSSGIINVPCFPGIGIEIRLPAESPLSCSQQHLFPLAISNF